MPQPKLRRVGNMFKDQAWALVAAVATFACAPSQALTNAELELGRAAGIPDSMVAIVRAETGALLGALRPLDSLGNLLAVRGIAIAIPEAKVDGTINRLQTRLGPEYLVLHTERNFGYSPDSVGVIRTRDTVEALRIRATSGVNYDIDTDSIIALYRAWHALYGLALQGAGPDFLQARILRPPADFGPLARAVFAACPDVVEQGTNTVDSLATEMRRSRVLYCWWD